MSEKSEKDLKEKQEETVEATPQEQASAETTVEAEEPTAEEKLQKELDDTKAELEKSKKEYMFLLAEFDNFRKRTLKEKSELIKEGVNLIYNKFVKYLEQKGVKAIESQDADFDTEYHEAVTTFPTDDESKKGKVIDTVQKGYVMNDKVIRHSKVVVGQ